MDKYKKSNVCIRFNLLTVSIIATKATNIQIRLLSEDIQQLKDTNKVQ